MGDLNMDDLEPNSHKYKSERETVKKEKLSPIIKKDDQIVSTKKPLSKKLADTFIGDDVEDIKHWVIKDVIIPGIKNTVLDVMQMMFFGEVDSRRGRLAGRRGDRYGESRTSYSSYYRGNSYSDRSSSRRYSRDDYYEGDDKIDFRNIVLRNREDAERVIEEMRRRIRQTNSVSVADLLDLVDLTGKYTDNNWGWDDERDIGIRRISTGFLIDVAEPKYLN